MHSLLTGAAVVGLWSLLVEPEWALLAVPIHLMGDLGLFGNSVKPFGVRFEPATHLPAHAALEEAYRPGRWSGSSLLRTMRRRCLDGPLWRVRP